MYRHLSDGPRTHLALARSRKEIEFLGPPDRCPTVVHAELGVDALRVSPHGVDRHQQLARNVWTAQVGSKKPKHVQFTLAERLDQALLLRHPDRGSSTSRQELVDVGRNDVAPRGFLQQGRHWLSLVDEESHITLRLRLRQRAFQRAERGGGIAVGLECERLERQNLDHAAGPGSCKSVLEETPEQNERVTHRGSRALCFRLSQ